MQIVSQSRWEASDVSVEGGGDLVGRDQSSSAERHAQATPRPQQAPDDAPDLAPSPLATQLRRILSEDLDLGEFQAVCFDLGVNYDHLPGRELRARSRELVKYLRNRNALPQLVKWLHKNRPDIKVGN